MPDSQEATSPEHVVEQAEELYPEYLEYTLDLSRKVLTLTRADEVVEMRVEAIRLTERVDEQTQVLLELLNDPNVEEITQLQSLAFRYHNLGRIFVGILLVITKAEEMIAIDQEQPGETSLNEEYVIGLA